MSLARPFAALALAGSALALSGCISIFPKQAAAQLYRFGTEAGAPAPTERGSDARTALILPPVTLPRASAGDQLLTVTGDEAAYVAGARWVSPAAVLWEEGLRGAFASRSARTRLLTRTEVGTGEAFLRVTVHACSKRSYDQPHGGGPHGARAPVGGRAAPTEPMAGFASTPAPSRFRRSQASENRLGPIVAAYDHAVEEVTAALIAWTDANAASAAVDVPAIGAAPTTTTTRATTTTSRASRP